MGPTGSSFKKCIGFACTTSAILLLLLASSSAYTQVLINGDFETGDLTGWVNSGNLFVINSAVISGAWTLDFNGANSDPNGEISQTVAVTPGQRYELTFKYGFLGLNKNQQLHIQVDGAGGAGSLIDTHIVVTTFYESPKTFIEYFVADTSEITLRISDLSSNESFSSDPLIDDIVIQTPAELIFIDGFENPL